MDRYQRAIALIAKQIPANSYNRAYVDILRELYLKYKTIPPRLKNKEIVCPFCGQHIDMKGGK